MQPLVSTPPPLVPLHPGQACACVTVCVCGCAVMHHACVCVPKSTLSGTPQRAHNRHTAHLYHAGSRTSSSPWARVCVLHVYAYSKGTKQAHMSVPRTVKDIIQPLAASCRVKDIIQPLGAKVNKSTGLHVHVRSRGVTDNGQIRRMKGGEGQMDVATGTGFQGTQKGCE